MGNSHEVKKDPLADGPYLDEIREAERNARREARMAAAEKYDDLAQEKLDFDMESGEVEATSDGTSLGDGPTGTGDSDDKPDSVSL